MFVFFTRSEEIFHSNKLLNEIFKYAFCVTKMCSQQRAFKMSLTRKERKKMARTEELQSNTFNLLGS